MTLRDKLFSFEGRIRRTDWWLTGLMAGLVALVVWISFRLILTSSAGPLRGEGGFYVYLALEFLILLPFLWVQTALNVKRGHDLNIPAWPFIAFQIFAVGSGYVPFDRLLSPTGVVTPDQASLASNVLYWVGCLVELVVLGFLPGTRGPNRFGPSSTPADKPAFIAPGGVE